MESKFDWLTLTIKPENFDFTFINCLEVLSEKLLLGDLIGKMVPVGRVAFYDTCIGYEGITLCIPSEERYRKQGFCLRLSSCGLDFFNRYLDTYNITFKQWLGMFRALCFQGFVSNDTRLDYAMDDIRYNNDEPVLTMKKVMDCCRKGEMSTKARVIDVLDGSTSVRERYKKVNKKLVVGRTVYVGSRNSEVSCRFYDKLAEQLQKKGTVPQNCTSWVRCEFELKGSAAMAALNAFLDCDEVDFGKRMRGVVNNYVSFIVRNDSNISRCSVKRWWAKFLGGCTEKFKLPHKLPARSAWARARHGLIKWLSIIYTMHYELGSVGIYKFFKQEIDKQLLSNPKKRFYKTELGENIRDGRLDYEQMNAFKRYQYAADGDITNNIQTQWSDATRAFYRARHLCGADLERHIAFMNGQEVL